MPKGELAHWLLSRATTPDRAEAAVGDLIEESELRSDFWFWKTVLRTTVRLSLTAESRRTWILFPALLDSTVFPVLIWFYASRGWQGWALIFVFSYGASATVSWIFPAFRTTSLPRGFGWIQFLWTTFVLTGLCFCFR